MPRITIPAICPNCTTKFDISLEYEYKGDGRIKKMCARCRANMKTARNLGSYSNFGTKRKYQSTLSKRGFSSEGREKYLVELEIRGRKLRAENPGLYKNHTPINNGFINHYKIDAFD